MIIPTNGTKAIQYHQPLRPVSCRRRTRTEILGKKVAKVNNEEIATPKIARESMELIIPDRIDIIIPITKFPNANVQNSVRVARPENSIYFLKVAMYESNIKIKITLIISLSKDYLLSSFLPVHYLVDKM
jgi:hypothetical protein